MSSMAPSVLRIAPTRGWVSLRLSEVWQYRELLYFLTWRDIKVRYRQTVLGVLWAILVPVVSTGLFTLVFARMANVASDGRPYPLFSLAALLPWSFFAAALSQCANSVAQSAHLMSKVYFPRLIAPLAAVLGGLPDFLIAFGVFLFALVMYALSGRLPAHSLPGPAVLMLPFFVLLALTAALGMGLWLAGLSSKYRDVKHAVPFMIQAWLFITPVVYSANAVTPSYRAWIGLNPMSGVVEGFRWSLLNIPANVTCILLSTLVSCSLLMSGAFFFRRVEKNFADHL
ncbi:MAG: ABC transporter permease [Longimicrobiales bacterium]